ncbi:MAG: dienelactone hydrolase family protein [Actinomycetota bacterium]|nr:dienelactone hydrolase family protein [Actinomycetota bacterium]
MWGADVHIRDVAERFAAAGYVALAPALYSTGDGRPEALSAERVEEAKAFLNSLPPDQWMAVLGDETRRSETLGKLPKHRGAAVGETLGTLFGGARDPGRHVPVLRAAVSYLRAHPACAGRLVGSVGFCMGGSLSAQLACSEPELSAAVVYYGSSPTPEQVKGTRCPLRGFYGQEDPAVVTGLPAFGEALREAGIDHELRVYPDTPHAFFNDTRPSYRPEPARDAWARTLAFFAVVLGPVSSAEVA